MPKNVGMPCKKRRSIYCAILETRLVPNAHSLESKLQAYYSLQSGSSKKYWTYPLKLRCLKKHLVIISLKRLFAVLLSFKTYLRIKEFAVLIDIQIYDVQDYILLDTAEIVENSCRESNCDLPDLLYLEIEVSGRGAESSVSFILPYISWLQYT